MQKARDEYNLRPSNRVYAICVPLQASERQNRMRRTFDGSLMNDVDFSQQNIWRFLLT